MLKTNQEEIANFFEENGFFVLQNAISEDEIDEIVESYKNDSENFKGSTAYIKNEKLLSILCSKDIVEVFEALDKGVALHMGEYHPVSTEKDWHQDCVLGSKVAGDNYIGTWIALEDIQQDSGPFEVVAGSHRWDMPIEDIYQFGKNEKFLELLNEQISNRDGKIISLLPKKGDIIFWHGHLIHRGSIPSNSTASRGSLIGHYCNMFANSEAVDSAPSFNNIYEIMDFSKDQFSRKVYGKTEFGYYFNELDTTNTN
jgi:ectoine hydroxylase-related dioxygenase (phytanoyl-CoA dioxygenase family)